MKSYNLMNTDPEEIISEATYICYAYNRDLGMTPKQLFNIGFKNAARYEARYCKEKPNTNHQINLESPEERQN